MTRHGSVPEVGMRIGPVSWSWTQTDLVLYALSIGARHPRDLGLLYEGADGSGPRAAGTFALTGVARVFAPFTDALGLDLGRLLHAGQAVELLRPPPARGAASVTREILDVSDRGRGVLLSCVDLIEDETGPLARAESQWWLARPAASSATATATTATASVPPRERTDGPRPPGDVAGPSEPRDRPDACISLDTWAEQPALHRLAGDRNPLHIDPDFARRAGQPGPILHGLCALGMIGHALEVRAPGRRLARLATRFSAPVLPGERIELSVWDLPGGELTAEGHAGGRRVLSQISAQLVPATDPSAV